MLKANESKKNSIIVRNLQIPFSYQDGNANMRKCMKKVAFCPLDK